MWKERDYQDMIREGVKFFKERKILNEMTFFDIEDLNAFFAAQYLYYSSQQYGLTISKYMAKELGNLTENSPRSGTGDYNCDITGINIEFKTCFLTTKGTYNILQIRPYEDIDYFLICAISPEDDFDYKLFLLSMDEMREELDLLGTGAHISKKFWGSNKYREYRITLRGYNTLERWSNLYAFNNTAEINQALNRGPKEMEVSCSLLC